MGKGVSGDITLRKLKAMILIEVVIFIMLLGLKLTIHTDWLWYYVTVPIWCGIPVTFVLFGILRLAVYGFTKDHWND